MQRVKNPALKTIKEGYKGNKVINGKFKNEYKGAEHLTFAAFIKWALTKDPKPEGYEEAPAKKLKKLPPRDKDSITWLGHASFLITINKKRILIDPMLTRIFPIKRHQPAPIAPEELRGVDYVCYTHAHRDHLDRRTLKRIPGNPKILVPLGAKQLVQGFKPAARVQAAGWWQQYDTEDVDIHFLPAYHWNNRFILDKDKTLWGSLLIKAGKKTIYHAGDTAYTKHFDDIRQTFGPINTCIMPATHYHPEDAMAGDHMSINDSVRAFRTLGGKEFIPMHYGTMMSKKNIKPAMEALQRAFKQHPGTGKLQRTGIGQPHPI